MQGAEIKKKVQSDIFFELCNVRLEQWKVAFCTGQNSCWYCAMWGWYSQNWLCNGTKMMFVVIQYEAGPIKSKIKVKTMGNLWIIVYKNPFAPSNIFDLRDFAPLYFHHKQRIQPGNYLLCRLHVLLLVENWTAQEATNFCASLYNENYWEEVQVVHFHAFIDNFMINIFKLICGYWLWVYSCMWLILTHSLLEILPKNAFWS